MATTDAGRPIKGAIYRHTFALRDTSGQVVSGATNLDSEYSYASGAFADCTNEAVEIGSSGIYYLELVAAETPYPSVSVIVKSSEAVTHFHEINMEPCLHSGVAAGGGSSSITLASTASATDSLYLGGTIEIARGTGAGQVRAIVAYTGSSKTASVDRDWTTAPDTTSVYVIHPATAVPSVAGTHVKSDVLQIGSNTAAATALRELYKGAVIEGNVSDSTPAAGDFDGNAALSATDDFYNNMLLVFTTGDLTGYVARINDYTGTSRNISLSASLPSAPGNGDEFCILAKVF